MDNISSVLLFILFFLPGFVSLKLWRLFHGGRSITDRLLVYDSIFFSVVNFAILSPVTVPFIVYGWYRTYPVLTGFMLLIYCFIAPFVWAYIWHLLIDWRWLWSLFQLPYPTAWDYFVQQRKSCFMLIHLKDDSMIGGYFGMNSYASASPDEPSVYLEKVFKVNPDGTFGDEIPDSFGLIISKEDYKYIELFYEKKE